MNSLNHYLRISTTCFIFLRRSIELHAVNSVPLLSSKTEVCPSDAYKQRMSHVPTSRHGTAVAFTWICTVLSLIFQWQTFLCSWSRWTSRFRESCCLPAPPSLLCIPASTGHAAPTTTSTPRKHPRHTQPHLGWWVMHNKTAEKLV